jgi:quercetin dioxygenase-like cupin family protein
MIHHPKDSRADMQALPEYFTGPVRMSPVIEAPAPSRVRSVIITFAPGARTAWHTHPLGQTLYITAGRGLAQSDGGPVIRLVAGDTVWFGPGERHWHGAAPDAEMTHLAVQEVHDGRTVDWMEPVAEADYARPVGGG